MHLHTAARLALALTAFGLSPAASASTAVEALPKALVPYHDLDLSNRADVAKFDKRIRKAARKVCTPENWTMTDEPEVTACMHKAIVSARPQRKVAIARAQTRSASPVMATLENKTREP